jgi:hypothetical protein
MNIHTRLQVDPVGPFNYFLNAPVQGKFLKDLPPLPGVPHVCHIEFVVSGAKADDLISQSYRML